MLQIAGLGFARFDQTFAHPSKKIKSSPQGPPGGIDKTAISIHKVAMIIVYLWFIIS